MSSRMRLVVLCSVILAAAVASPVLADEAGCHRQVLKQLLKFEKTLIKVYTNCLDQENLGKIPGPCLDATGQAKLDGVEAKVDTQIGANCTAGELAALGFSSSCADYGSGATTVGAECAALPASNVSEIVDCLECWKSAELKSYVAALYASHALETCGGAVDSTSPECQPLACASPQPEQRNLGSTGADSICQKGIGKAGFKYMLKRSKVLSNCGLAGSTRAACLADPIIQEKLALLEVKKQTLIQNKCGNVNPEPVPVFCCRTGVGNECVAASTRADCELLGFTYQDDKFCDIDLTCQSVMGDKQFAWWGSCPDSASCPGAPLGTTDDITGCVDSVADRLVDRLLCLQIPRNLNADWPCPSSPSAAFLE